MLVLDWPLLPGWLQGWLPVRDRFGWPVGHKDPRLVVVVRVGSRRVRMEFGPNDRVTTLREAAAEQFAQRCLQFLPRGTEMQRPPRKRKGVDARGCQPEPGEQTGATRRIPGWCPDGGGGVPRRGRSGQDRRDPVAYQRHAHHVQLS